MIFGIGTDIVRVVRMQQDLDRFGDKFAARILTEGELKEFHASANRANFLARRFAAKEAAAKAMGTGFSQGVLLTNIEVTHDANGKPLLEFHGQALRYLRDHGVTKTHISLADEQDHAVAFVTLEAG
ncbi:MAG: holo-ACP synthase [Candidatus Muproteobacteria bacterium RIFCSPHIGHO2_01_FULL_65_16]|uniref:Holo-[acyl-carrier-protein] synthase n=2 Tax=Candidatus Muproteobacteria TaxID=1817795 RepID=A0A1F6TPS7_9PROT|nr:MAG: holo-ACP synthase [Candidatus Muproteobacteria bacterium RIFCSPHIGHO2_01_FULL_65_16]OGI48269.1 MAG: holo-ACP synthase [Candidatus Muproteobacteria bacterium RIFCSPHIGHO2_02_FULL_65_16]